MRECRADRDKDLAIIPDTGCEFAPRCLECRLPACRYDMPPRVAGTLLRMMTLLRFERAGLTVEEAATRAGVSRRTAFRLKRDRGREPYRTLLPLLQLVQAGTGTGTGAGAGAGTGAGAGAGTGSGTSEAGLWTSE